jgi:hypothetical protein
MIFRMVNVFVGAFKKRTKTRYRVTATNKVMGVTTFCPNTFRLSRFITADTHVSITNSEKCYFQ